MDEKRGARQAPIASGEDQGPFRATLTAHRSLGPRGFLLLMSFVALVSFATGVAFLLSGAWPVLGFFGLDVLLIYLAFRLNYRAGRLYETIEIRPELMTVMRVHPSGRAERFEFNPYWLRVQLDEGRDGRTALWLRHHERAFAFARFLTDDERRELAGVLRRALSEARGGVRI